MRLNEPNLIKGCLDCDKNHSPGDITFTVLMCLVYKKHKMGLEPFEQEMLEEVDRLADNAWDPGSYKRADETVRKMCGPCFQPVHQLLNEAFFEFQRAQARRKRWEHYKKSS